MTEKEIEIDRDICCECGESVRPGSGKFVNRIPVFDDYETRKEQNRPYPEGAWICAGKWNKPFIERK